VETKTKNKSCSSSYKKERGPRTMIENPGGKEKRKKEKKTWREP